LKLEKPPNVATNRVLDIPPYRMRAKTMVELGHKRKYTPKSLVKCFTSCAACGVVKRASIAFGPPATALLLHSPCKAFSGSELIPTGAVKLLIQAECLKNPQVAAGGLQFT
jgi:hypothetical protein